MFKSIDYKKLINWLKSGEVFARPSKQLPGKWQLFEFYFETETELVNLKETDLKAQKISMILDLVNDKSFLIVGKLNIQVFNDFEKGTWHHERNFLTLAGNQKSGSTLKFQFDANRQQLKLLKKDGKGKIVFFGFFSRVI